MKKGNFQDNLKASLSEYAKKFMASRDNEKTANALRPKSFEKFAAYKMASSAGVPVDIPTLAGIETLVKDTILSEISKFGEAVPMDVKFVDFSLDEDNITVLAADGEAVIHYGGKRIAIPFFVREGKLLPFQSFFVNKDEFLYSTENLMTVLKNLVQAERAENAKSALNPYAGVKDYASPLNDTGYMEEALRVRDLMWAPNEKTQRLLPILASIDDSLCNEIIEKAAGLEKDNSSVIRGIVEAMVKKAEEGFEQLVGEDEDGDYSIYRAMLGWLNSRPYWKVTEMDDGTDIEFVENRYKDDFSVQRGVVFKNVSHIPDFRRNRANSDVTLVISEDGRFTVLKPGSNFYATPVNEEVNVSGASVKKATELCPGEWYTVIGKGEAAIPFKVLKAITADSMSFLPVGFIYSCQDWSGTDFNLVEFTSMDSLDGDAGSGLGQFEAIDHGRYRRLLELKGSKAKSIGTFTDSLCGVCLAVSPDTEFVHLSGRIANYLCDPVNLRFTVGETDEKIAQHALVSAGLVKTAEDGRGPGAYSSIKIIRRQDVPDPLYDVRVRYPDMIQPGRMRHEELCNIEEGSLNSILRKADVEPKARAAALDCIHRNPVVVLELNETHTPERLSKDYVAQKTGKIVADLKRKVFNKENMADMTKLVAGNLAAGMIDEEIINAMGGLAGKVASLSRDICVSMEKYAQKHASADFLKIAKLLAVKNAWDTMLQKIGSSRADFAYDKELLEKTAQLTPHLEKAASFLVRLNTEQMLDNEYLVPDGVIKQALDQLQILNRMAKLAKKECDKTAEMEKEGDKAKNKKTPKAEEPAKAVVTEKTAAIKVQDFHKILNKKSGKDMLKAVDDLLGEGSVVDALAKKRAKTSARIQANFDAFDRIMKDLD